MASLVKFRAERFLLMMNNTIITWKLIIISYFFVRLQSHYQELPPSLAVFSVEEPDIIIYTGYGMHKQIQFYSMSQRKVSNIDKFVSKYM